MLEEAEIEGATPYWDFCKKAEVAELLRQLNEGLIHPLEYASSVTTLAATEGL